MPRGVKTLSTMNRSYQEKISEYGDVVSFFRKHFEPAEICILSSHVHAPAIDHLREMIRELRLRTFNVAAVFFSNGYNNEAEQISLLDWDERLWVENPVKESDKAIQSQIARLANEFANLLIARAAHL
jgi:aspartyl/asparaginyl beta-hydroxylase (cupin superfamily)